MKQQFSVLLIIALMGILFSCKKENESTPPQNLTVGMARGYFESQVKKTGIRSERLVLPFGEPNWDSAYNKHIDFGEALAIPLNMTSQHVLSNQKRVQGDNYLLVYKKTDGILHHEVITVIPSSDFESPANFNGVVIVRDWAGNVLRGFNYKDGKYEHTTITIGQRRGVSTEKQEPCFETSTTVCFPMLETMGTFCTYGVQVSSCPGGGAGGEDFPGSGWGGNGGIDPGSYPSPTGGGSSGGAAAAAFDRAIDSSGLKPCMKTILSKITKLSAGKMGAIITKFAGENPGFNWKTVEGKIDYKDNAITKVEYVNGTVTTIFDSRKAYNASELHIARMIMHESVHAYLVAVFRADPIIANADYAEMVLHWNNKKKNEDLNTIHHDEMVRSLVKNIGDALEDYGKAEGYNLTSQFYHDLAWGGLNETSAFKALPTAERERIHNTLAIEQNGIDDDGNYQKQSGKPGGC